MKKLMWKRKRFLFWGSFVFVICGIALGYAVLSQSIKINGTGTISTNWDILFTSIAEKSKKGATTNDSRITDKLTATFDVDLESPGSYIEYNVKIRNNGNMDAVIAKVAGIVEANSADPTGIQFKVSGIRIGDDLLAGSEKMFVVRAEIPASEGRLPTASKTLDLKVDVRQKEVDSSGLVTTLNECFQTNEVGDTITGYLCGKGNTNGYSEILDVNIPSTINGHTITQIGTSAFSKKGLTSVILPNTIKVIGASAFYKNQLTTLELPDSITRIGDRSFEGNRLRQLRLSDSIKTIGGISFASNQLSEVEIPNSVTVIGSLAFEKNELIKIEIPSSVTTIGEAAFRNNKMPDEKAFIYNRNSDGTENMTSLNSYAGAKRDGVVVPNGVEIIGSQSLRYTELKSIVLPEGLKRIEIMALNNNGLTEITIPASVTSLSSAFQDNKNLSSVVFQGNVPVLERSGIFKGTKLGAPNTIKVPIGMLERYKSVSSQTWFGSDNASLLEAFYE